MGRRVKAGTVVAIEFDDHVQGADYVIRCVVYGRVHKCSPEHITVKCWDYAKPTAELDHNVEIFTIMQSAITKVTRYGKG
jgi:hypothetical protein